MDPYRSTIVDPKRQTFAGMLSAVDEGIDNVTNALRAVGALDSTLIVFTGMRSHSMCTDVHITVDAHK